MKLKLKHVSYPEIVYRLEVPNECGLNEARERCLAALAFGPGCAAGDVVLSLNKKSPLVGEASETLKGLGVCSGDLLWVLAPEVPHTVINSSSAPTAASRAAAASSGSSGPCVRAPLSSSSFNAPGTGAASATSAAQAAGAAAVARAQAQQVLLAVHPGDHQTPPAAAEGVLSSSVASNTSMTCSNSLEEPSGTGAAAAAAEAVELPMTGSAAMDVDVPSQQQQDLINAGTGDAHEPDQGTAASAATEEAAAAAVAAAADLDHPPAKPWMPDHLARILDHMQQQQQMDPTELLLLTVHAAMLESGLKCLQQQQRQQSEGTAAAVQVPQLIGCGGVYSLSYTLPGAVESSGSSSGSSSGGSSGGSSSGGTVVIGLKAVDVGNYLVLAGSITAGAAAAAGDGTTTTTTTSTSTKLVATINLPKAAASAPTAAPEASTSAAAAAASIRFSDLPKLWVLLKDKLCLPLMVAGCAAAGIAAPVGLSSLPFELQEAVLSLLEAKNLAALCCTCTPMRHRAATGALWKPLFDQEFPPSTSDSITTSSSGGSRHGSNHHPTASYSYALHHTLNRIRQDANRHGWKWAFGAAWAQRKRILDEERRQARGSWPPHRAPYPNPMPWGPFRPQNPMMPPNIIGGDYDRFPNLGGFGGLGGTGVQGFGGLGFSAGVLNPGVGGSSLSGIGVGSGGALFSGAQGRGGVLPGGGGSGVLGTGGGGGIGFPGLGGGRRREGGGGVGRLY